MHALRRAIKRTVSLAVPLGRQPFKPKSLHVRKATRSFFKCTIQFPVPNSSTYQASVPTCNAANHPSPLHFHLLHRHMPGSSARAAGSAVTIASSRLTNCPFFVAVEYGTEHRFRKVDAIEADGASVRKLFEPRFEKRFELQFSRVLF